MQEIRLVPDRYRVRPDIHLRIILLQLLAFLQDSKDTV